LQNTVLWLEWNSKSIEQSLAFGWWNSKGSCATHDWFHAK
jgi:hypothetical protein